MESDFSAFQLLLIVETLKGSTLLCYAMLWLSFANSGRGTLSTLPCRNGIEGDISTTAGPIFRQKILFGH